MRLNQPSNWMPVVLMVVSAGPVIASTTTMSLHPGSSTSGLRVQSPGSELLFLDSLREDVARYPGNFVSFETQISADRFIVEHGSEASRETEQRMISRGIAGYWRGKILVVLPSLSTANPR